MLEKIIIAGFGGQGVMTIGKMLAYAGILDGREASWVPSYGPEMRGGTAYCNVIISDEEIASPVIAKDATTVIAMNLQSLNKFEPFLAKGGRLLINSSLITEQASRDDVNAFYIPVNEIAMEAGNTKAANMVVLGAYLGITNLFEKEAALQAFIKVFGEKSTKLLPLNQKAMELGIQCVQRS